MTAFEFVTCGQLIQIHGLRADDERELAVILGEVSVDSVHYHTHGHFLRHGFVGASYPNDFATWAANEVRDRSLAERLAVVSPLDYPTLEGLREEILTILDDHLSRFSIAPRVSFGEPFEFMQARIVEVPTGVVARSLADFRNGLAVIPANAIYFHTIEATRRLGRSETDFTAWLREGLGMENLAAAFSRVDPYTGSLERLRTEFLHLCDAALPAGLEGAGVPQDKEGTTP